MGAMFLPDVEEELVDTSGFLRAQRERLVRSRTAGLSDLARLDERLEAQVDALLLSAEAEGAAVTVARASGERFVEAFLAVRLRRGALLHEVATRAAQAPGEGRGPLRDVVAALGWAPWADADEATTEGTGAQGVMAALRLHAMRVHRRDPGELLALRAASGDGSVRAAALRAIGELGRADLMGLLLDALDDKDARCHAWAAWSGALLGAPRCAAALVAICRAGCAPLGERALEVAVRAVAPDEAAALLRELAATGQERRAIAVAGGWGDVRVVPWLLASAARPELARLVGWAFTAMTGVDLSKRALAAAPPPGFREGPTDSPLEHDVSMDPDASLPWPDPARVGALWAKIATSFLPGVRYRFGHPIEDATALAAAVEASQVLRAAAALDEFRGQRRGPLFSVRAPAFRQSRLLRSREGGEGGADVAPH
ncbi:TIGR02270 family protein [Chondromyces crocatus]|uniref:TIGR02270 family protein n=1 Tax=Chondromyces crocatus TaxID=52 RepID=A0A0K1E6Y3_CHOCO|nr:TIGR02270 family protein [Chondromyces crocatus]AKT36338.1 uncharacterized protein CMC5_004520 [Chondromyces crocatus]